MKFLSDWAKKLSWLETARSFKTSWQKVLTAVKFVVEYGLKYRGVSSISSIAVDEIAIQKGHKYLTVVYAAFTLQALPISVCHTQATG